MKYAIHACEGTYEGLHGIYSDFVVEVRNRREAYDKAVAESLKLMESYSFIMDSLSEDVYHVYGENIDESDFSTYLEELMGMNVSFEMCRVDDDAPDDIEISYEDFVEKYKIPEILE